MLWAENEFRVYSLGQAPATQIRPPRPPTSQSILSSSSRIQSYNSNSLNYFRPHLLHHTRFHRNLPFVSAFTMDSQTPTTFTKSELERALSEQSFGISAYEIVTCTELEASAVVTLLEGKTVSVSLTPRGYTVCCYFPCW